jgi:ribosomal protein S18 acetylase RimI-like enzyme
MAGLTQRAASISDLKDIWGLLGRVAADVPFDFQSEAEQESILSELMACCISGLSPIAVGEDKAIIGALLVRRDDFDWGFRNGDAIHVSYAAIDPDHRNQGVLPALVAEVQQRKVPVYASVKTGNQFGFADELKKLGFAHECAAVGGWGDLYKWLPPAGNRPA